MRLPQPGGTRAVLVGTSCYTKLPDLPGVVGDLSALSRLLRCADVLGLPEDHVQVIAEPESPRAVDEAIRAAAAQADDTLIVYYAGHGLVDGRDGQLYLAVGDSDREAAHSTAVPYSWVRNALLEGPSRRVVVLDCCFSGRALNSMSAPGHIPVQATEVEGTAVLAAAHENQTALAAVGEALTAFTGELVRVLDGGIVGEGSMISLRSIYLHVQRALRAEGRPIPQAAFRNSADEIAFRNRSWIEPSGEFDPSHTSLTTRATRIRSAPVPSTPDIVLFDHVGPEALRIAQTLGSLASVLARGESDVYTQMGNLDQLTYRSLVVPLVDEQYVGLERAERRLAKLAADRKASEMPVVLPVILAERDCGDTVIRSFASLSFRADLSPTRVAAKLARDLLARYAAARPAQPGRGHDASLADPPHTPHDGQIA